MAQSRFSAFLQRVRLLITGQSVQERRQELGHQFSTDATPTGRVSHEFTVGNNTTVEISHTFTVPGILLSSGINHEFTVDSINQTVVLTHQFNIDSLIDKEKVLSHIFTIPVNASSGLSHSFDTVLNASSGLNQEFNISSISTTADLNNQFNVNELNKEKILNHSFGVSADEASILFHTFTIQQTTDSTLSHEINVSFVNSEINLNQEFNVNQIDASKVLEHIFGIEFPNELNISHSFGVNSQPQSTVLSHDINIYAIQKDILLEHEFNIDSIQDHVEILNHQFGLELKTSHLVFHQFTVAYDNENSISHELDINIINSSNAIGHSFQMNVTSNNISHQFSAIGVAENTTALAHSFNATYTLPSNVIQHEFNLRFSLVLPEPTVHTSDINYILEESNDSDFEGLLKFEHPASHAFSYSDVTYSAPTSSGTWSSVDPNTVISLRASGLDEGNFFHGSFVFKNETYIYPSGSLISIPEYLSDTTFLRQKWNSPVVTTGETSFRGLNDFPLSVAGLLYTGENFFPAFFGRQLTVTGLSNELLEITLPVQATTEEGIDPFVFNFYTMNGSIKIPIEKEFLISGVYLTRPTGTPGTNLRRGDSTARLGFTYYEQEYQPEELTWKLGHNTLPEVYDQIQTTDQWINNGLYRDFTISGLKNNDFLRGQIRASSPSNNTFFNGIYPSDLLAMSSAEIVNLHGGGILVWPDISDIEHLLNIYYSISGIDRGRIPALITLRFEDINSQPRVLELFRNNENNLEANVFDIPANTLHNEELGTFKIYTEYNEEVLVSGQLSNQAFAVYRKSNTNSIPKVIFTTRESD